MKIKQLLTKTLLMAVGLLMTGTNAYGAVIETVGESDCSTTDLAASSTPITLANGKFIHYTFTQNRKDGGAWNNMNGYHLIANDGSSDIIIMRPDAWENVVGSGDGFTTSWSDWDAWRADMDGSTVDMYVSLNGTSFSMTATITGKSEAVYTYTYNKTLGSAPASLDIRLSVHYAYLQITTADLSNTITYDVDALSAVGNLTLSGSRAAKPKNIEVFQPTNCPDFYGRMAFQNADTWNINVNGLANTNAGKGRHFAILDLLAGDKVTLTFAKSGTYGSNSYIKTRNDGAFASLTDYTEISSGQQYTVSAGHAMLELRGDCRLSEIKIETLALETMTSPSIDSEADGDERTVTITAGASNLLCGVTTYYTTDGSDPDENATEYTAPFNVAASCTVKAITISNSSKATESTITSQYIDLDAVDVPTAAITAVDGINRTVTFSCTTEGAVLYYSTDNGANYTPGTSLVISSNTNIKVKATKGLASAESENLAFEAGTTITLNTPTWTKTGYSAGVSTVTLADNQSDKLLNPATTIKYQIDDNAEQTYSTAINVNDGETLKYWSVASGYTDSDKGSVVANAPNSDVVIVSENYVGVVGSNNNLSLADGEGYRRMYYNEGSDLVSENLLASNINNGAYYMMYRASGLYPASGWNLAITNLQAGDYITLNGIKGNADFEITGVSNMTADLWNSTVGSKYCYTVNADGQVTFTMARYGYLQSITIQRASVSVTVTGASYATYVNNSCDLNFSATSIEAYKVKVSSKGVATMTKVDNVPAGTPVLLYKDGGATEDIPVMTGAAAVSENDLVAGTGVAVATTDGVGNTNMILNNGTSGVGFYLANGQTVAANRAYLHFNSSLAPDPSAPMMMVFDGEATGIADVRGKMEDVRSDFFDLQGRKVAQPAKGLYIQNGRKVILK